MNTILLGAAFAVAYGLSFPLVIPGGNEPILLHRWFGAYTVYAVFPLLYGFLDHLKTLRKRLFWGWLICSIASLIVFYWAFFAVHTYGGISPFFTFLMLLAMMGGESLLFWVPFIALREWLVKKGNASPALLAGIWTSIEASRNFFPVDFFWAAIGHSQYDNLFFIQWAAIGSNYILSFFIVWTSSLFYAWAVQKERRIWETILVSVLFLLMTGYSSYRLWEVKSSTPIRQVRVALLQPNFGQEVVNAKSDQLPVIVQRFTQLLRQIHSNTDLIVWHEAAMPVRIPRGFSDFGKLWRRFFPDAPRFPKQIIGLDIVDLSDKNRPRYYNSAGFIEGDRIAAVYDKIKLAPFGEYLPWSSLMESLGLTTIVPSSVGSFARGTDYTVHDFGFAKASVLICYDGTFSENVREFVRNGADLLVGITNDAWFGRSSAPFQHAAFYRFRAVETGRTIVRAANTGVSGVILPDGSMPISTPIFVEKLLVETVPIYRIETPYLRWGNVVLWMIIAGTLISLARLSIMRRHPSVQHNSPVRKPSRQGMK
mgnify:CR=1 FL=1